MLRLHNFLQINRDEILQLTEEKTRELAGTRRSSEQLKQGLPIFFEQLLGILLLERPSLTESESSKSDAAKGAANSDEQAIAMAGGRPEEAEVAKASAVHGTEMFRLGYTLSHVVHAYGAMCQSITELAEKKNFPIAPNGFRDLNQCLDVAIAGAVTEFQRVGATQEKNREDKHLGFLTHEMRNALTSATVSLQLVKRGTVGLNGNTGRVLEESLKRMEGLIDRSLTEIRLRVDPDVHIESERLLVIVDRILLTAEVEAESKRQKIEIGIDPDLVIEADQQAFYAALSNLIQNAIKFTREGGTIQVRGKLDGEFVVIEVEDECGGLPPHTATDLFKAFEQRDKNRTGLGLGLTIAQQAILLNRGTIDVRDLRGKGCVFKITLPKNHEQMEPGLKSEKIGELPPTRKPAKTLT
jgi:signal transduction histidine kinase